MDSPFHQKLAEMKRAAKNADIALLLESDGYIALGANADTINRMMPDMVKFITLIDDDFKSFNQVTISLEHIEQVIAKLNESEYSVALLDRVQKDMKSRPYLVRVCKIDEKDLGDFC